MNHNFCKTEFNKFLDKSSENVFLKDMAYVPLKDGLVAKLHMETSWLRIDIISTNAGVIDTFSIKYSDVFAGRKGPGKDGERILPAEIKPGDSPEWKFFEPSEDDYKALANEINKYLNIWRTY